MKKLRAEDAIIGWDNNAEKFASYVSKYGDDHRVVLLTFRILDILGNVEGLQVLDAGCGEGWLSRLLAERGAAVTAVDFSKKMLEIARERTPEDLQIDYQHGNLENLSHLTDHSFDIIVSVLVIQDLPEYQSAIQELFRVLKPGGKSILIISHPCFSSDGEWIRDDQGNRLYWKIDNYFYERDCEVDVFRDSKTNLIYFHRTLTSYFRTIKDAGFVIEDMIEPYPSQESIQEYPRFIDDLRMCHFLIFALSKGKN